MLTIFRPLLIQFYSFNLYISYQSFKTLFLGTSTNFIISTLGLRSMVRKEVNKYTILALFVYYLKGSSFLFFFK